MADRSNPLIYCRARPAGHTGGQPIDLSERVYELTYEDEEAKADKLTLSVDNYDLANFDDPIWAKGTILQVQWGYAGNMCPARECVIQSVKGFDTLKIEALDKGISMNKIQVNRTFEKTTRSAVIALIAKEEGYAGTHLHVEDTDVVYEHIVQARMTNAQFLKMLAGREGFEFYVDFDGLHWHRKKLGQKPIREFTWFGGDGDLLTLNVENDVTAKPAAVVAKGRDPLKKENFEVTGSDKTTQREGVGPVLEAIDPRHANTYDTIAAAGTSSVSPTTEPNGAAAKRVVDGQFRQSQITVVQLQGTSIGDPSLLAKSIVQVNGIRSLSGKYYLSSVKHTVNASGFVNEWKGKRDGRSATPGAKPALSAASQNTQTPKTDDTLDPVEKIDGRRATTTWTDTRGRG